MSGWIDLLSWILHWPGIEPESQRLLVGTDENPYELEGIAAMAYSLVGPQQDEHETD